MENKQELPKLGTKEFNDLASAYFGGNPKQETLKEAAEKYGNNIGNKNGTAQFDFIQGAKWQQERMYSEEEVEQLIHRAVHDSHCRPNRVKHANSNECAAFVNEWFEQFKKKVNGKN